MKNNNPIISPARTLKKFAVWIIKISFGFLNKKIIYLFLKKFFYKKIKTRIINCSFLYNLENLLIDRVVILYFEKPKSYTGEYLLEIQCHGDFFLLKNIINCFFIYLKKYNIEFSKNGEFTKRAFFNNKINIFDLELILNPLNFKNLKLKEKLNVFNLNIKKKLTKIFNYSKNLIFLINSKNNKIYDFLFFNNNLFKNLNNLKKKIFSILNFKKFIWFNLKNQIIIIGFVNVGKSTFINNFIKVNYTIVSSYEKSTKNILEKNFFLENLKLKILDTPGFCYTKNKFEYLNLILSLKFLLISKIIIFIFDTYIYYNMFFYYIKRKIKNNQLIFKLINKSDFFKNRISLEIFIVNKIIKRNIIKISALFRCGIILIVNELKKKFFKNFKDINNIILNILKKSYNCILKSIIFFFKNEYLYLILELKKFNKILNILINKKNKFFFNKIFKSFCIGK